MSEAKNRGKPRWNINKVPEEVKQIIEALDNPERFAILTLLSEAKELSINEMERRLELGRAALTRHLKTLYTAGLVDHYFRREPDEKHSYYAITPLGKRVLAKIAEALAPLKEE